MFEKGQMLKHVNQKNGKWAIKMANKNNPLQNLSLI